MPEKDCLKIGNIDKLLDATVCSMYRGSIFNGISQTQLCPTGYIFKMLSLVKKMWRGSSQEATETKYRNKIVLCVNIVLL